MKSKFTIEIETKDMEKVFENKDGTGEDMTKSIEKELHQEIRDRIKESLEEKNGRIYDAIEEEVLEYGNVVGQSFECFEDYGKITFKVGGK